MAAYKPDEARGKAPGRGALKGKRVLVVGAGTKTHDLEDPPVGNGRAIAVVAGREGAHVVCADIDGQSAQQTVETIRKDGGFAHSVVADVTDADGCQALVDEAFDTYGGLEGVVLNHGVSGGHLLEGTTPEMWDQTMALNLRSYFVLTRLLLPRLQSGAAIVFITSTAASRPGSMSPTYDASKHGLVGLMQHTALEAAPHGIRVNSVAPGTIDTPIARSYHQRLGIREDDYPIPLGRLGTGWDIGYTAGFLLSDWASYITGKNLEVDGGWLLTLAQPPVARGSG